MSKVLIVADAGMVLELVRPGFDLTSHEATGSTAGASAPRALTSESFEAALPAPRRYLVKLIGHELIRRSNVA